MNALGEAMPGAGWSVLASFLLVLAAIPVVLWLGKRSGLLDRLAGRTPDPAGTGAPAASMRVLASLPVSASQRLLTVQVRTGEGVQHLVIGVSPGQISALATLRAAGAAGAAGLVGGESSERRDGA
jgi:flagellar biogenesis protein FliO